MLQIGSMVDGKYKILNKIGQGGMSVVYLALNERANKTWAIKEVRKDGVQDFATVRQGLIAETNILKSLSHKYLPSIIDVIDDSDTFLIVMDYIQGKSLKEILAESIQNDGYPISVEDVISWGKQLCDVLYYLHTRPAPIIYRDMKPSNVMLKPDGEISLIDFGTARVFKTGNSEDTTCLGTPGYAAPEQYGGNGQSRPQTDIYCLGATMHHLITGRDPAATPFNFPKITQCRPTLLDETPRDLRNILLGLEMIIDKCTQYEIKDRYQSCAELKYDLEHPEELGLPYRRKLKNKMMLFGGCAAMAVLFGVGSLVGLGLEKSTQRSGYDYYVSEAATASSEQKTELYREAVSIDPTKSEAYLEMLDVMLEDNVLSSDEVIEMTSMLNNKDNNRSQDNKTYLQANDEAGYVKLSYQLGMAYYFYGNNGAGDKPSSVGWFANVENADMSKLNFDNDSDNNNKTKWQQRAVIFGRIGSYYKTKLGQINQLGDAEVSYADYWYDLMALMDASLVSNDASDDKITELRLYNEVAAQINSRVMDFKEEANIDKATMENVLDDILTRVNAMTLDQKIGQNLKNTILTTVEGARKNITAAFAYDSLTNGSTEGGDN